MDISAVIVTLNDEKRLEPALRSLEGVVSEVVVLDGGSADGTAKLARKYTPRVHERAAGDPAAQKNHAAGLASFPWVLALEADERLSPELRDELLKLRRREPECAGFSVPRRTSYLGRWVRHSGWAPDRPVRLFRRDRGRWEGDALETRLVLDGPVERLGSPLHRFPFATIGEHAARVNRGLRPGGPAALRRGQEGPAGRPRRPADAPVPEDLPPQARLPRRLPGARHLRPRRLRRFPALGQAPLDLEER